MKALKIISLILVIIGAINWGLVGLIDLDLVAYFFGYMSLASKIAYIAIGVAGVLLLVLQSVCCMKSSCGMKSSKK
ncbi:MAG: DUF378 domain-containing protein [Thiotrichales bacterium]|nr:MAG: DUF378 domain-containing protein [Thiotrichales bacterium]